LNAAATNPIPGRRLEPRLSCEATHLELGFGRPNRSIADAVATPPVEFQVSTDVEMGMLADAANAAKALDDEQMKRVASEALRAVRSACPPPARDDTGRTAGAAAQR
jgi:hypothetical protein